MTWLDRLEEARAAASKGPWRDVDPLVDKRGGLVALLGLSTQVRCEQEGYPENDARWIALWADPQIAEKVDDLLRALDGCIDDQCYSDEWDALRRAVEEKLNG